MTYLDHLFPSDAEDLEVYLLHVLYMTCTKYEHMVWNFVRPHVISHELLVAYRLNLVVGGYYMYHQVLTFRNSTFCLHSVFMCFVWISEQTAIISLYSIN
jgi:hypothetical protein